MLCRLALTKEAIMGFFRRIEEHGTLMSRMMRRTGADVGNIEGKGGESALRSAIFRCIACTSADSCRDWLADAEPGSPPPAFCRNAELFRSLVDAEP
jgi:hypothetical protein